MGTSFEDGKRPYMSGFRLWYSHIQDIVTSSSMRPVAAVVHFTPSISVSKNIRLCSIVLKLFDSTHLW